MVKEDISIKQKGIYYPPPKLNISSLIQNLIFWQVQIQPRQTMGLLMPVPVTAVDLTRISLVPPNPFPTTPHGEMTKNKQVCHFHPHPPMHH